MSASDLVSQIDTLIANLLSDFSNIVTYRIGEKEYKPTEALEVLRKMRADYYAASLEEPYEDVRHVAYDHSDFGEDESEYIGDES
jgi:hypothetical protein